MTMASSPELLVLHAVRISGFADSPAIARRFRLDPARTAESLSTAEASGWVARAAFADLEGWHLTETGRAENERQLAVELASTGAAEQIRGAYRDFLPLNGRLQQACTDWQLRRAPRGRFVTNDHTDTAWDDTVLDELTAIERALAPLAGRLADILARFGGYHTRFAWALYLARAGECEWVEGTHVDSCHRVWFELHEDLIATLGIDRGGEA